MTHQFFGLGAVISPVKEAEDYAVGQLRKVFSF